jgi:hypothetical protein
MDWLQSCLDLLDSPPICRPWASSLFAMAPLLSLFCLLSIFSSTITASGTDVPKRRAAAPKPLVGAYTYQGCFAEPASGRALPTVWSDAAMTLEKCAEHAASQSFAYFGVEFAKECWVGNALNGSPAPLSESACASPCKGDAGEVCGGSMKLNLYKRTALTGGAGGPSTGTGSQAGTQAGGSSALGYSSLGW